MSKALIVVESPAKAKTIQKYLGKDFVVMASKGHVRDLPKSGNQIDVEHGYKPHYEVLEDHKSIVADLKRTAKEVDEILLAPDPDREGEAIAWHIAEELKSSKKPMRRIEFHEITKKGVLAGLEAPHRQVDQQRFEAQQARRILDRLIGYELSPVLWKRLCRQVNGHYLSAGRVQSAALRLIVDREEEIQAFTPVEYWPVGAMLLGSAKPAFNAQLVDVDGVKVITPTRDRAPKAGERVIGAKSEAESTRDDLAKASFKVASIEKKERRRRAPPPYITSSLQRDGASRLGFSASRTMQVAQRLYEGIDVGTDGPVGLITYMRTDSTRMSTDATDAARAYIGNRFGVKFVPEKPNVFKAKGNAQDAHEAVRPTSTDFHPDAIRKFLKPDEYKVYRLIWERFLACQMVEAVYDSTTVAIDAKGPRGAYALRASGQVLKFPGWLQAQGASEEGEAPQSQEVAGEENVREGAEEEASGAMLPELREGETLALVDPPGVVTDQKFTQPISRYNEGTLVKSLEDLGIGRPSTYAEIVSKVLSRDYVEKQDRQLVPTKLGMTKTRALRQRFPEIVNYEFTANIEADLDKVEAGEREWVKLVDEIYKPFHKLVQAEMQAKEPGEGWPRAIPTDRKCEKCGKPMNRRWGPNSDFYACTGYPECKNIVDENPPPPPRVFEGRPCPKCGKDLLIRVARRGSKGEFLGCSGWPECDYTSPMPTGIKCPKCGGDVVKVGSAKSKRPFYGCSNYATTKCDFKFYQTPVMKPCPKCGATFLVEAGGKTHPMHKCVTEGCGYEEGLDGVALEGTTGAPDATESKPKKKGAAKKGAAKRKGPGEAHDLG